MYKLKVVDSTDHTFENFYFGSLKLNSIHISQRFTVDSFGNYASCGQEKSREPWLQHREPGNMVAAGTLAQLTSRGGSCSPHPSLLALASPPHPFLLFFIPYPHDPSFL
ncbi:hypothetical protein U0070_000086 [Myodes glareolus]|uniref:Uncharacterized protein n=1 Tax=Myodes glareolus TaxID=447135 RepID=A0AAW0I055_MYOGA